MHLLACQTQSYHSSMFGQTQKDTHELRTPRSSGHLHAISFWSRDISQMCLSWGYFYDRSRYYCAWYLHSESKALKKNTLYINFCEFHYCTAIQNQPALIFLLQCQNLGELNTVVTLPMFGYKDFNEVYLDSSPHFRVEDISIPVVAMNAADDPFCPEFGMHFVVIYLVFVFELHWNRSTSLCTLVRVFDFF